MNETPLLVRRLIAEFLEDPGIPGIYMTLLASYRDRGLAAPESLEERLRAAHDRWTARPPSQKLIAV